MIATPDDYSWCSRERFPELADAYCFTYVRGLTPEELVTRLGVRVEDCSRMTLDELIRPVRIGAPVSGSQSARCGMWWRRRMRETVRSGTPVWAVRCAAQGAAA
ncbi:DUF6461 domain-containing protein, partial [Streptosporangium canum]|uniref:DUF6461 domain-containing protein n=1 Tax=Streptosporangium canum TaxID=324952 RepID=UPI003F4DF5A3